MKTKSLLALGLLVVSAMGCGLGGGLFPDDRYAIYGQPSGTCWLQATTEAHPFGPQISATFDTESEARQAGCQLVQRGRCEAVQRGTGPIACP